MQKDISPDPPLFLKILKQLISYKSVTPKGKDALEYIAAILTDLGFKVDLRDFGESNEKTWNLYAYRGDSAPNICFAGHVDVVPAGDLSSWIADPFKLTLRDDLLYGRGIVDMKGAIACYLAAIVDFLDECQDYTGCLSFLLTSDEEGSGKYGTKRMLEYIAGRYASIDFCIVGEPTSENKIGDMVKIGRRGSMNFQLTVGGRQGHVAYPDLADNPIPKLIDILAELENMHLDGGMEFFLPSNLEVTSLRVENEASNVIPQEAHANLNIRFNTNHDEKSLLKMVLEVVSRHTKIYKIEYDCSSLPFVQEYSKNMQKFTEIVRQQCSISPKVSTSGGTSDARFIHKYSEVIEFGLKSGQAHKINEHCEISDLQTLCNVYYAYLVRSFKSAN